MQIRPSNRPVSEETKKAVEDSIIRVKPEPGRRRKKRKRVPTRAAPADRLRSTTPVGRPAPAFGAAAGRETRARLYAQYGLVFDPAREDDPITTREMDNLLELYRRRTGAELDQQADVRKSLEDAGLIERAASAAVRKVAPSILRRVADEAQDFVSATDALDYLEQKAKRAGRDWLDAYAGGRTPGSPFYIPRYAYKTGERAYEMSKPVLPIVAAPAVVAADVIEEVPVVVPRAGVRTNVGGVAEGTGEALLRGAAFGLRQTARGMRATGRFLADRPILIGTSVVPMPAAGEGGVLGAAVQPRTVAPVTGNEYMEAANKLAEAPQAYIDVAANKPPTIRDPESREIVEFAYETGMPVPVIREIMRQQEVSPFSPIDQLAMQSSAAANGWPEDEWPRLDLAEKIYRATTKNDFAGQFFRSLARGVGETAAAPAGLVALIDAAANAAGGDYEMGESVVREVWGPYAQARGTSGKEGELEAITDFIRDNPLEAFFIANTALRGLSRGAGAAARAGMMGERMERYAEPGVEITVRRGGPEDTARVPVREEPGAELGWMDFRGRGSAERRRQEVEERNAPITVGVTTPRLFQTFATRTLRRRLAESGTRAGERYRSRLQKQFASRQTRWTGNVRQGEVIEMREIFERALSEMEGGGRRRSVPLLVKDRAAFNLIYPLYDKPATELLDAARLEGRALTPDEQAIVDNGRVTPARVAEFYESEVRDLQAYADARNRDLTLSEQQQIDLWKSAAIHLRKLDNVEVPEYSMRRLRAEVAKFGEMGDRLMAEALTGETRTSIKRQNYIRMILIDPEFEVAAQRLRGERVVARGALNQAEARLQSASRKMAKYLTESGWGSLSRPKARARYNKVRTELLNALRAAERAAERAGLPELAAQYRADRLAFANARLRRNTGRQEALDRLERMESLRLTPEERENLPLETRAAYDEAARAAAREREASEDLRAELRPLGLRRVTASSVEAARRQREELEAEAGRGAEPVRSRRQIETESLTIQTGDLYVNEGSANRIFDLVSDALNRGDSLDDALDAVAGPRNMTREQARIVFETVAERRGAAPREVSPRLRERLQAATERETRLGRAQASKQYLAGVTRQRDAALKKLRAQVRKRKPIFDTEEVKIVLDRAGQYAVVDLKQVKEQRRKDEVFSIGRARNETLDEFIARAEMLDTHPVLHLVGTPEFDRLGQPRVEGFYRRLDTSARGGIRGGRFMASQGFLFRTAQESPRFWDNLLFDTAELITAPGWTAKIQQIIERTSIPFNFNERALAEARRRAERRAGDERVTDEAVVDELKEMVDEIGVDFNIGRFVLISPQVPTAKIPPRRLSLGALREAERVSDEAIEAFGMEPLDAGSLGRAVRQQLDATKIDPNNPGTYYLVPEATWKAIQQALDAEAFRIRPSDTRGGKLVYRLDAVTRAWRTFTLNVLPRTAFNNFVGSAILAAQAGAGPWSMYYAAMAIAGKPVRMADGSTRKLPVPPELRQRYYEVLTGEINASYLERRRIERGDLDDPNTIEMAFAGMAGWMNTMRTINGMSEDWARLAVWYSKAYPEARSAALGGPKIMAAARGLNDKALDVLEAMARNDATYRTVNEQFLKMSFEFLGDLHQGGKWPSAFRIAIPFYQWYQHMLKLTFFTMPYKYPGRALFLQQLADIGVMFQQAHGLFLPYGEDFIPFYTVEDEIEGDVQEMVRGLGAGPWYPQGTTAPIGGRFGMGALGFAQNSLNPIIPQGSLILASMVSVPANGYAVEMDERNILRTAQDQYGNEIDEFDSEFWRYLFNKIFRMFPLSSTIMSQSGRASTAVPWDPAARVYRTPQMTEERRAAGRGDIVGVIENPRANIGAFISAIIGLRTSFLPARGPISNARLSNEYRFELRDEARKNRNIFNNLKEIHGVPSEPARERFIQP